MRYEPLFSLKGLNLSSQTVTAGFDVLTKINNWGFGADNTSPNRLGIITKNNNPATDTITATLPAEMRCRGLFEFYPQSYSEQKSFIIAPMVSTEYTAGKFYFHSLNSASNWRVMLDTDGVTEYSFIPYSFSFVRRFDSFRVVDTAYMANGETFRKYFNDDIDDTSAEAQICSPVYDCGATPNDITGNLTWTEDDSSVTTDGTFPAKVVKGCWIRVDSSGPWYEVKKRVSDTEIELRTIYKEATETASASQYAAEMERFPKYIIHWKDMNIGANFSTDYLGIASYRVYKDGADEGYRLLSGGDDDGDKRLLTQEKDNAAGLIIFTDVLSETTPAALETWSNAALSVDVVGYLNTLMTGINYVTGIAALGEYFFVFGENEYVVYRFNADNLPPVTEVHRQKNGCNSFDTIQKVDDYLIYFTGTEVRMTNGFSDVSISAQINGHLQNNTFVQITPKYLSKTATDNNYPSAFYDSFNRIYHLYLTNKDDADERFDYAYSLDTKEWVSGPENSQNIAKKIETLVAYSADEKISQKKSFYFPVTASDTLYEVLLQSGQSAVHIEGELQSGDVFFGDITKKKELKEIEFWMHIGPAVDGTTPNSVTFEFNYYLDNVLQLSEPMTYVVTNDSETDRNYFKKMNFKIRGECFNFKWSLKDVTWTTGNNSAISLIGGYVGYEFLNRDK